ncbi:MAG: hypothetical protein GXP26_13660 [Planctomycetes bacterium]|nr:hypothetical protein [Planctomycetota bacterium]
MIRILFPLIGYISVATVITLGAGYGYLRSTHVLDDQRMFRIVSLLHGIDLDEIAETYENNPKDVPAEEPSYDQQQEQLQVASLQLQAKQDEIEKEIDEFDARLKLLNTKSARFNSIQKEVESFLDQRREEAIESGIVAVRSQLKNLIAKKQAKPLLVKMLKAERTDEVILLLVGMSPTDRKNILKTFISDEEIDMLYNLQRQMLNGDPEKSFIDGKLDELKQGQK